MKHAAAWSTSSLPFKSNSRLSISSPLPIWDRLLLHSILSSLPSRSTHPWPISSSLPKNHRRCPLDLPTHDQSPPLSWSTSLSLSLSLVLPPSLSLTDFLSLMKGFVLIFISLSLYIEIFYYKICLEAEKMWETSRKIAFSACNQTLENIFLSQKYFHLKIFYTRKIFYILPNMA